jgi:hypothetical protein
MHRLIIISLMLMAGPAWADEIYLRDGTMLKGKVTGITDKFIEYTAGDAGAYDFFPRDMVARVVYDDGTTVTINEIRAGATGMKKTPSGGDLFLEVEWGWNGYVGFGPRIDYRFAGPLSVNAGAGLGLWGIKLAGGLRYHVQYPYGLAFGAGAGYNTGGKIDWELRTVDPAGVEKTETVELDLKPVPVLNLTLLYSWKLGGLGRMFVEAGYGFPLEKDPYRYSTESGNRLSRDTRDFIRTISPGGVIVAIGYAFML